VGTEPDRTGEVESGEQGFIEFNFGMSLFGKISFTTPTVVLNNPGAALAHFATDHATP
jgi:hypothetical protein